MASETYTRADIKEYRDEIESKQHRIKSQADQIERLRQQLGESMIALEKSQYFPETHQRASGGRDKKSEHAQSMSQGILNLKYEIQQLKTP